MRFGLALLDSRALWSDERAIATRRRTAADKTVRARPISLIVRPFPMAREVTVVSPIVSG